MLSTNKVCTLFHVWVVYKKVYKIRKSLTCLCDTGWNDKIVSLEKTTWFHFRFMKTGFLFFFFFLFFFLFFFFFFVADHLVGQLCTNPKSDRSLLSCRKVTQYSTSEIRDAPLYNSCPLPIQVMTTGPLPTLSKCKSGWFNAWGHSSMHRTTLWRWWSGRPHHATSHLRSRLESQHQSIPGCAEECGVIRWPVANPGCGSRSRRRPTSPRRPRLGFKRSTMTLYPSLTVPSSPDLNLLDYFVWSYVENITNRTSHNTKANLIAAIRQVFAELPPALVEKACSQFRIRIEAVIEAEGGFIE